VIGERERQIGPAGRREIDDPQAVELHPRAPSRHPTLAEQLVVVGAERRRRDQLRPLAIHLDRLVSTRSRFFPDAARSESCPSARRMGYRVPGQRRTPDDRQHTREPIEPVGRRAPAKSRIERRRQLARWWWRELPVANRASSASGMMSSAFRRLEPNLSLST